MSGQRVLVTGRFEESPPEEWDGMMRANLATVQGVCRAALPHLLERGGAVSE
jgi:NADP-dependent 3-hydroxy acid dehydrogenase YdfG